jgi:hypothetical protein
LALVEWLGEKESPLNVVFSPCTNQPGRGKTDTCTMIPRADFLEPFSGKIPPKLTRKMKGKLKNSEVIVFKDHFLQK